MLVATSSAILSLELLQVARLETRLQMLRSGGKAAGAAFASDRWRFLKGP